LSHFALFPAPRQTTPVFNGNNSRNKAVYTAAGRLRATSRIPKIREGLSISVDSHRASIATKWLAEAPIHHADAFPYNQYVSQMINTFGDGSLRAAVINRFLRPFMNRAQAPETGGDASFGRKAKLCTLAVNVHQRWICFLLHLHPLARKLRFPTPVKSALGEACRRAISR